MKNTIITKKSGDTVKAGIMLGKSLTPGAIICLWGALGSGKTTFVKGIALGLGIDEEVTSPTFAIVQRYSGSIPLYHVDLYRISDASEIDELGIEDFLGADTISAIEWPEKLQNRLSGTIINVRFRIMEDQSRELLISGLSD